MDEDRLVVVFEAPQMHADVVAGALDAKGIRARVFAGHLDTTAHPGLSLARVLVAAADAARAREIIDEVES